MTLTAVSRSGAGEFPPSTTVVPAWLFPTNSPVNATDQPEGSKARHLPGSAVSFTEAQLGNLFAAPDWHPATHSPMPDIVAHGRGPDVYACGFCHTPSGQGRPENAALAGLPARYITQQILDFRDGARRSASPAAYRPADRMIHAAMNVSDAEVKMAAAYFAAQKLRLRVHVIERAQVPQPHVVGWVYVADAPRREEPLGVRMLEFAPDADRQKILDDEMVYTAYVPPGSIERGRLLAQKGRHNGATACTGCHGPTLCGTDLVPPIAGRSPTYLLRELFAFKTGARAGANAEAMRAVITTLDLGDLIDAVAFAASRRP